MQQEKPAAMDDNTDFTDALLDTDSFLKGFDLSDDFPRVDEAIRTPEPMQLVHSAIRTPEPMQLDFSPKWPRNSTQSPSEKIQQHDLAKFDQLPDLNKILSQSDGCVQANQILLDQLSSSVRQDHAINAADNFLKQDNSANVGTAFFRENVSMNGGKIVEKQHVSINGGPALLRENATMSGVSTLQKQDSSINGGSSLLRQNDAIHEGAILLRPSVLESTIRMQPLGNQDRVPVLIPNNQAGQVHGGQTLMMTTNQQQQSTPRQSTSKIMSTDFISRFPHESSQQQLPPVTTAPIQYISTVQSPPNYDLYSGRPFVIRSTNPQTKLQKDLMTFSFPTTLEPRQFLALSTIGQDPREDSFNADIPTSQTYLIKPAQVSPSGMWFKNETTILSDDQEPPSPSSTIREREAPSPSSIIREREPPSPTSTIRERRTSNCSLYNRVSTPSPVMASNYSDQKYFPVNYSEGVGSPSWSGASPKISPRPSPKPTPPPVEMYGRESRSGKRTRPETPTSDNESDKESLVLNAVELKPRLEELEDEEKYNKRKNPTGNGDGKRTDFNKSLLDQLQRLIPHIGDPEEEKVSQAGILCEGGDYVGSLKREINAISENVKAQQEKIEKLNAEIEAYQMQLPEHGSPSIHRIVSRRGKSIPDMFADHVRMRTQTDWRYWVFTSIMGHFIHSYSQEVSNISPTEMQTSSLLWVQERMSLQALRKDAYRKLTKLSSKTSIMDDPSKLPSEARSFVDLEDVENREREEAKLNERELKYETKSIH